MIRKRIAKASVLVANHVHSNQFSGIVVSGGSNQLSRALFTIAWRASYPGEQSPRLFVIPRTINQLLYKADNDSGCPYEWVSSWLAQSLSRLWELRQSPLCYLDDYLLTGHKCRELSAVFAKLGFQQMQMSVFAAPSDSNNQPQEVYAGVHDNEVVKELYQLSMLIQGQPSVQDLLSGTVENPDQLRLRALKDLRSIAHHIAAK